MSKSRAKLVRALVAVNAFTGAAYTIYRQPLDGVANIIYAAVVFFLILALAQWAFKEVLAKEEKDKHSPGRTGNPPT
jgi:hypothetical protein